MALPYLLPLNICWSPKLPNLKVWIPKLNLMALPYLLPFINGEKND